MKKLVKFLKPWYSHPVFVEGSEDPFYTITFAGEYNFEHLPDYTKNVSDDRFVYFKSTFQDSEGKDFEGIMEVLKEVVEFE